LPERCFCGPSDRPWAAASHCLITYEATLGRWRPGIRGVCHSIRLVAGGIAGGIGGFSAGRISGANGCFALDKRRMRCPLRLPGVGALRSHQDNPSVAPDASPKMGARSRQLMICQFFEVFKARHAGLCPNLKFAPPIPLAMVMAHRGEHQAPVLCRAAHSADRFAS
jgi:hypothetical protein